MSEVANNTIKFNVGGRHFELSRALIEQQPGSMLWPSIRETWQDEPAGTIFIDRNGHVFGHVLEYLRYRSIVLPAKLPKEIFVRDLDFYGISYNGVGIKGVDDIAAELIEEAARLEDEVKSKVQRKMPDVDVRTRLRPRGDERWRKIQLHRLLIEHASACLSPVCPSSNCSKMKAYFRHLRQCALKMRGGCVTCRRLWFLLQVHCEQCEAGNNCPVPYCMAITARYRDFRRASEAPTDGAGQRADSTSAFQAAEGTRSWKTVRLNVGGRRFEVPIALIEQHAESMLFPLISERWHTDPEKTIFIDRDGHIFARVLAYLRSGVTQLPTSIPKEMFIRNLDFYGIYCDEDGSVVDGNEGVAELNDEVNRLQDRSKWEDEKANQQEECDHTIHLNENVLHHASTCTSRMCSTENCSEVKGMIVHLDGCKIGVNGACVICKRTLALLRLHARSCGQNTCPVPKNQNCSFPSVWSS